MQTSRTVGIIANPASARDVRRVVAHGGAVTTHDKLNRLQRVLAGLSVVGIERVISMSDRAGITGGLMRLASGPSAEHWPELDFVDQPITGTEQDTRTATRAMIDAGVGAIVVLGGDGTNRIVATESDDVPLISISTGTNNAFPQPVEPTVAGLAAGLVATNASCRTAGTYRAKSLVVEWAGRVENALVDIAISTGDRVGAGAVWDPTSISELFLCFAEPQAVGLSAIGGHVQPTSRRVPNGLRVEIGTPAITTVHPPIGPGLMKAIEIRSAATLTVGETVHARTTAGVVAIDGERMFRFGPAEPPAITLHSDGPMVVDVVATLDHAASTGVLTSMNQAAPAATTPNEIPTAESTPTSKEKQRERNEPPRALFRDGPHPAIRVPNLAGIPC